MYFHEHRQRRSDDPATAQAKSFSAIRKAIYDKLPKVKTGDEYIDKQESRWNQTKALTMANPEYANLVELVDPIHLLKYNKASKSHNEQLRARVDLKQTDEVKKFSIEKCMQTAFDVLKDDKAELYDMFVALLYVTGRRQHELWSKMDFSYVVKDDAVLPYTLEVWGFAKSMSSAEEVEIPCLFDVGVVLQRIGEVRMKLTRVGVNLRNRDISKACKKLFPDASTPHQLRALYAETCERIFNNSEYNDKQIKAAVYKKNALHHGSIKTSNEHYEIVASDLQSDAEVAEYHKKFEKMNAEFRDLFSEVR